MNVSFVHFAASGQQQVQDQHVPGPPSAGRLSQRDQLHICAHAGRAGEVSERARTLQKLSHCAVVKPAKESLRPPLDLLFYYFCNEHVHIYLFFGMFYVCSIK